MVSNVVDLIMQDHREVERLFEELKNDPAKRPTLLPSLMALLIAHSRAEEAEVYPAARDEAGGAEEVEHSQQEHLAAEQLLERLAQADPASTDFDSTLQELVDAITHHVQEEEETVLPGMQQNLPSERLDELGRAFLAIRQQHLGAEPGEKTKEEMLQQANIAGIAGASSMRKEELEKALQQHAEE
jgi:hemerythrin superfamily protein